MRTWSEEVTRRRDLTAAEFLRLSSLVIERARAETTQRYKDARMEALQDLDEDICGGPHASWRPTPTRKRPTPPDTSSETHPTFFANINSTMPQLEDDTLFTSGQIIDTGCSFHLENISGLAGFTSRRPTDMRVATGLSTGSRCDFIGTHTQYVLGAAPTYAVIKLTRPNTLMHRDFRKPLFSPRQAWTEQQTTCAFADVCELQLASGDRIPFYDVHQSYILPRWFTKTAAMEARQRVLRDSSPTTVRDFALQAFYVVSLSSVPPPRPTACQLNLIKLNEVGGVQQQLTDKYSEKYFAQPKSTLVLHTGQEEDMPAAEHRDNQNFNADPRAEKVKLWHARTAHVGPKNLMYLPMVTTDADDLRGITREKIVEVAGTNCTVCPKARMTAKPHSKAEVRGYRLNDPPKKFGDCIGTDNAGPFQPSIVHQYLYLTVFIDFKTNIGDVFFQKHKGYVDSIPVRKQFIATWSRYGKIHHFHSDAAQELMGAEMLRFLTEQKITASWSVPGESNMNNRAEGYIGRLTSMVRAILVHSGVPSTHWPALYLMLRTIRWHLPILDTKTGQHTSPWIELTGELPTARRLVVPCCVAYGLIPRKDRIGKLGDVAMSGIFMGYPRQQQGGAVLIWKPNEPSKYYTVYSVRFDESKTYRDAWRLGKEVSTAYGRDHHTEPFIYEEEPSSESSAGAPMTDYGGFSLPTINVPPAPQEAPPSPSSNIRRSAEDHTTPPNSRGTDHEKRGRVDLCRTPGCRLKKFHLGNCSIAEPTTGDNDPEKTISQRHTRQRSTTDRGRRICLYHRTRHAAG